MSELTQHPFDTREDQNPIFEEGEEMLNDPWKHRSVGMLCKTCMWFVEKVNNKKSEDEPMVMFGRCRRHAPTMNGYPAVFGNDWCGDHKLDENKK